MHWFYRLFRWVEFQKWKTVKQVKKQTWPFKRNVMSLELTLFGENMAGGWFLLWPQMGIWQFCVFQWGHPSGSQISADAWKHGRPLNFLLCCLQQEVGFKCCSCEGLCFKSSIYFPKCDYWHTSSEPGSEDLLVDSSRVLRRTNVCVQQLSEFFCRHFWFFFFNSTFKRKVSSSKMGYIFCFFSYFLIWGAIPHRLLWWQSQSKKWQPCFMLLSRCKKKKRCQHVDFLGHVSDQNSEMSWVLKQKPGVYFLRSITSVIRFRNGLMCDWRREDG